MDAPNREDTLTQRTKEGLVWNTLLPFGLQVFRFVVSILIARILEPRDFGIMGIASIVVFYSDSFTNFGFSTALIQKKEISEKHVQSVFSINLGVSTFLAIGLWFASGSLAGYFAIVELEDVFQALSVVFLITTFSLIPETLLRRNVEFRTVSQIQFLRGTSGAIIALVLAWMDFRYWALVIGLIGSNLLTAAVIILKVRWRPCLVYHHQSVKEIFEFSLWNFFNSQARLVNDYVDKFIIGKVLGPILLGFYEKAFTIAYMPVESVANQICGVMFSAFSRYQDEPDKLLEYYRKSLITISALCFPLCGGLMSVSSHFTVACLGGKWTPIIPSFNVLLLTVMIVSLTTVTSMLNIAAGRYREQIGWRAVCLAVLVFFCVWAARSGIVMIAYAVLAYSGLFFVGSYSIVTRIVDADWPMLLFSVFPAAAGTALMYVVVVVLASNSYFSAHSLTNLFALTVIGAVIYVFWILGIGFPQTRFLREEALKAIMKPRQH